MYIERKICTGCGNPNEKEISQQKFDELVELGDDVSIEDNNDIITRRYCCKSCEDDYYSADEL